ncbi:hypothetical protein [Sphingomonas sp.]|uniref:hypothetical protein n=1 Tax=Sphingomonas sp. TaxID=28214 RepID=UPI003752BC1A
MTKKQLVQRALIGTALALPLAACGGGGGGSDSVITPPVVVTTAQEDKFGIPFGINFRAAMNSPPASVSDGDIVPISSTNNPIDITP